MTAGVALDFDADGLIPVITQDADTGTVLMMAYASPLAVQRTQETGLAHYYSRSRDELWQKGATSGHTQHIEEIRVDCDGDVLLYSVTQDGGACHTGYHSCFFRRLTDLSAEGDDLTATTQIVEDRQFDPEDVYE